MADKIVKNVDGVWEGTGNASETEILETTTPAITYNIPSAPTAQEIANTRTPVVRATITCKHVRAVFGNNIDIFVQASPTDDLERIEAVLDGVTILKERFSKPVQSYSRQLNQCGGSSPGLKHVLNVEVFTQKGEIEYATYSWEDSI